MGLLLSLPNPVAFGQAAPRCSSTSPYSAACSAVAFRAVQEVVSLTIISALQPSKIGAGVGYVEG